MVGCVNNFYVRTASRSDTRGFLHFGSRSAPCVLGRTGVSHFKREKDGKTPAGAFSFLEVFYRAERMPRPRTRLPLRPIFARDGWCDAPQHPNYNRLVRLPFAASHERLMRKDGLYDVVIVLDYNINPCKPGAGSAIFFHIAPANFTPTQGCIAVSQAAMQQVLLCANAGARLWIG